MKLPFKHIAILVLLSLAAIFAYQAYWLVNLYNTRKQEYVKNIFDAMRISDYNEMMLRVSELRGRDDIEHGSISTSAGFSDDEQGAPLVNTTTVTQHTSKEGENLLDTVVSRTDTLGEEKKAILQSSDDVSIVLSKNKNLESLFSYFQSGIHSGLDIYLEPNLQLYDSLLTITLAEYDIRVQHCTEMISLKDSTILASVRSDSTYVPSAKANHYDYHFNIQSSLTYRFWMESTDSIILRQMSGILTTSFCILLVLGFAFWYLIRTILQLKTLEEITSDFTNNITHELKTPIAVAYAANDALLNFNQAEEKAKRDKYLQICQEQLQRLSGLVEQILSMSMEHRKTFRLHPERLSLKELIDPLLEQHRLKADRPLHIACDIAPEDLHVTADRSHLSNIISNLIDNAVKYSPERADVFLRCRRVNDGVDISVTDRGIGIPVEKQKLLFDKFYRVPTGNLHNVKGYGLGLYYVRTMVEQHGGIVSVSSTLGQGSTFTLHL